MSAVTHRSVTRRRLARALLPLALLAGPALAAPSPSLRLEGASGELRDNLRAHLQVDQESCELPRWRERGVIRHATEQASEAHRALGYYQARSDISLERTEDCWQLVVHTTPGPQAVFIEVTVKVEGEASALPAFHRLMERPGIAIGDPLRHDRYEQLKNELVRMAADFGFFESSLVTHRLQVDPHTNSGRILLHLRSGPRYHFGEIDLQQDVLYPRLAQRFVPFAAGDPYDARELIRLQQQLNSSGYYSSARVMSDPEPDQLEVPVTVTTEPRPKHGYMAGIGFSTDTGPRLRLGYENRRLNRAGHRYSIESEASPVRRGLGMNYEIPIRPAKEKVTISASYLDEETDSSTSERYRLGTAHQVELNSGWIATTSLEYEREHFEVAGDRDRTELVMPGFELSRTRADHPVYPRHGWHLSGKVRVASEDVLSSVTLQQFIGRGKYIMPLFGGRLLARTEVGLTHADEVVRLPSSVRFFAGGDNSVRGYSYQSLGPRNNRGDVIGGRHLLTGTVEYDHLFLPQWAWAVFVDGGNAFDKLDDFDTVYGYGLGIRWRSPIGPIRLDVARPSDGRDNFRIHVSMGTDL